MGGRSTTNYMISLFDIATHQKCEYTELYITWEWLAKILFPLSTTGAGRRQSSTQLDVEILRVLAMAVKYDERASCTSVVIMSA